MPQGWGWAEDNSWEIVPDIGSSFDKDAGLSIFMEEVYEQNFRYLPGSAWNEGHTDKKPFLWADYLLEKRCE